MNVEDKVWSFIENNYPNFSSCDEIARNNDMHEEIEEGKREISDLEYIKHTIMIYERTLAAFESKENN